MAQPRMPFVPPKNTGARCHVSDVTFRVVNWRSLFSCYSSHVHINRGSSLCMKSISLISQLVCLPALHTNRLILSPPLCLSYLINACTLTHRLMLSVSICQLHTDMTFCLMSLEFKKMKWLILKVLRHSCWLCALMTAVGSPCKKNASSNLNGNDKSNLRLGCETWPHDQTHTEPHKIWLIWSCIQLWMTV